MKETSVKTSYSVLQWLRLGKWFLIAPKTSTHSKVSRLTCFSVWYIQGHYKLTLMLLWKINRLVKVQCQIYLRIAQFAMLWTDLRYIHERKITRVSSNTYKRYNRLTEVRGNFELDPVDDLSDFHLFTPFYHYYHLYSGVVVIFEQLMNLWTLMYQITLLIEKKTFKTLSLILTEKEQKIRLG